MRVTIISLLTIFIIGCSSNIVRKNQSHEHYYAQINKELANKDVILHYSDNSNTEGEFIHINNDKILLASNSDTLRIDKLKVHSIIFEKSGPSWFVGALAGFAGGSIIYALSGARFDLGGGGGKYPHMISIIPALTVIGTFGAPAINDYYKTFILKE